MGRKLFSGIENLQMNTGTPGRTIWVRSIETIFFSNYFLGVLAVALSIETSLQLSLPLNSGLWYLSVFAAVILYYTFAYVNATDSTATNPRTRWYAGHHSQVRTSQRILALILMLSSLAFVFRYGLHLNRIPIQAWVLIGITVFAAAAYGGRLPFFDLRQKGWTKAVTIGWCWAITVSLMPLIALQMEKGTVDLPYELVGWLFLKNWMFCNVNAILFDIKDYADDSNRQLKTFVVRYGIRFTIAFIILPLTLLGIGAFLCFANFRDFYPTRTIANLLPFILTLAVAFSLQRERSILYYLIVIDGMLLVKALCGIGAIFISP